MLNEAKTNVVCFLRRAIHILLSLRRLSVFLVSSCYPFRFLFPLPTRSRYTENTQRYIYRYFKRVLLYTEPEGELTNEMKKRDSQKVVGLAVVPVVSVAILFHFHLSNSNGCLFSFILLCFLNTSRLLFAFFFIQNFYSSLFNQVLLCVILFIF